ncbi:acyl-CoA thioesterase [Paenibacillus alkalitolerans]|uniref:acyl-CoA thioesterase n=1 Tax=Paenibacillus alkalitolerans TaxID=2799335 RepID=UPI0018F6DA32|nr:thioesterase family protein [Paenibacillus alkalitolerans]
MKRERDWHTCSLRVRYSETDQMGVVYHANYLTWFEIGRTEFIREKGMAYKEAESLGLLMPVVDVQIRYLHPARYDDVVEVRTRIAELGAIRMRFEYEIRNAVQSGAILATGRTEHVWVGKDWKPVRLAKAAPEIYRVLLETARETN